MTLLIDAANVVGSRPNGWWRDRPGAAHALVARLRAAGLPGPVVVVLEGAARSGEPEGSEAGVQVVHAPASGDDTLALLAAGCAPATLVSADRELGRRVRQVGAQVHGPRWLLDQLPPDS